MGSIYLVRHGQASFGAADYDQLSALGERQCRRLGEYFAARGRRFDRVITGTLKRHDQSWAGIAAGLGSAAPKNVLRLPGLNEYDGDALIHAIHPEPLARPTTPELYRHHFRLLKSALRAWMADTIRPAGMPSFADFAQGVADALEEARRDPAQRVLVVSSGGPISTAITQVMGIAPEFSIELNMRLRNSAVSEFEMNSRRSTLLSYNTLPHLESAHDLDDATAAGWITHA